MTSVRMHPYRAAATKVETFRNFYNDRRTVDPADCRGRQTAYTDAVVARMPPGSPAAELHAQVLALHERTEELVLDQHDYWNGPMIDCDLRVFPVENVPAYKDGEQHGYDLGIWLPEMLQCVELMDPHHCDDEDDSGEESGDDEVEAPKRYFFPDQDERERMERELKALAADIRALMKTVGV